MTVGFVCCLATVAWIVVDCCEVVVFVGAPVCYGDDVVYLVCTGGVADVAYAPVPAEDAGPDVGPVAWEGVCSAALAHRCGLRLGVMLLMAVCAVGSR